MELIFLKESDSFGENRVRLPVEGCHNCPIRDEGARWMDGIRVSWGLMMVWGGEERIRMTDLLT